MNSYLGANPLLPGPKQAWGRGVHLFVDGVVRPGPAVGHQPVASVAPVLPREKLFKW
jgi:hypothetical protein